MRVVFQLRPNHATFLGLLIASLWAFSNARGEISVDVTSTVRTVPPTFLGTNIYAHGNPFASDAEGVNYQERLKAAKIKVVRSLAYPDIRKPEHGLDHFDKNFSAILKCGAQPLFVQYIKPGLAFYREDGTIGTAENPGTPESNLVFMVRHYQAAPFGLMKQTWQVGNEPDIMVDWKMTAEEYAALFNRVHDALVKAGLRDSVLLCGPVTSVLVNSTTKAPPSTAYFNTFLELCKHSVDILDMHSYTHFGAKHDELLGLQRIDKLDGRFVTDQPSTALANYDGYAALLAKMETMKFGRPNVGFALTEYGSATNTQILTGGLWNLAVTQECLYNPKMKYTNSFTFDSREDKPDTLSHFSINKQPNALYWSLWIAGNLRGDRVLARHVTGNALPDGRPLLLTGATMDEKYLYIEVINRGYETIKDHIMLTGTSAPSEAEVFTLAQGVLPNSSKSLRVAGNFEYEFPAASATVFRVVRKP